MSDFIHDEPMDQPGLAIRRRHVLYVEGYDPLGTQWYYDLFRRTCERCRRLWPLTLTLHPLAIDSADFAHWRLDLSGSNWQVATRYDFLRMESFIGSDMKQTSARQLASGLGWCFGDASSGVLWRIFRTAGWRFAVHLVYFQLLLLAWLALAGGIGFSVGYALSRTLGLPISLAVAGGLLTAFVALFALRPLVDRWRVIQICSCWATLRKFGRGRPTWIDRVVEAGAQRLLAAARANEVDELVLVGHSTGGVLAAAITVRALDIDPDLGKRGPKLALLTLGSVMPAVALHPAARRMREIVARLATAENLTWVDCQSRKDVMCFFNFDPVDGIGVNVGAERCNPLIWRISFKDMIAPENYNRFRWDHFRVHYQYIMGGERPAPYDYILLVGGPMPIAQWPTHDRAFMAAMMRDEEGQQCPLAAAALGAAP
jgi:pimeloyl-ACP methyl ester carboxylesterase